MNKEINIPKRIRLVDLLQFAEKVITPEGHTYYHIPYWIQECQDNTFAIHKEAPNDLTMFICKSGLGGNNPQPQKSKL